MKKTRIGSKTRQVVIKQRLGTLDALNKPVSSWVVWKTLWASIMTPNGMASIKGGDGVQVAVNAYSFRVNYQPTFPTVDMRLEFGGQVYDIVDVRHDHATRDYTDLVCRVGANNG